MGTGNDALRIRLHGRGRVTGPRWSDAPLNVERSDGLRVEFLLASDRWIVQPKDGRKPIHFCPCCGATIRSVAAAKAVADYIYPLA